jgi:hypothetical protein
MSCLRRFSANLVLKICFAFGSNAPNVRIALLLGKDGNTFYEEHQISIFDTNSMDHIFFLRIYMFRSYSTSSPSY